MDSRDTDNIMTNILKRTDSCNSLMSYTNDKQMKLYSFLRLAGCMLCAHTKQYMQHILAGYTGGKASLKA